MTLNCVTYCRQRRWFSRAWIVQEVALSREIIVECGPLAIDWDRIDNLATIICSLGWQPLVAPSASKAFGRAIGDETVRLWMIRNKVKLASTTTPREATTRITDPEDTEASNVLITVENPDENSNQRLRAWYKFLQALLDDARPYSATDPRDKIFANFGIAQQVLPPGMAMPIKPDYSPTSTPQSVYEE